MFRLPLAALVATAVASLAGLAIIVGTGAKPTDLLALDPDIVNANTGAACAPGCDLTDPADLLAVADADGDGDGRVEAEDFDSLDVDGDQLPATAGTLWVLVFVDADGPVVIDPGLHLRFVEDDLGNIDGELQCDPAATDIADEDCDFDGIPGDGAVVGTLQNRDAVPGDVEQVEAQQEGRFMALAIQVVSEAGAPTPTNKNTIAVVPSDSGSVDVGATFSVDLSVTNAQLAYAAVDAQLEWDGVGLEHVSNMAGTLPGAILMFPGMSVLRSGDPAGTEQIHGMGGLVSEAPMPTTGMFWSVELRCEEPGDYGLHLASMIEDAMFGTTTAAVAGVPQPMVLEDGLVTCVSALATPTPTPGGGNGLLRVVTSPAVPSVISIDGTPRNDWGLDWLEMPPGTYLVSFSDVPGFFTPDPQVVTVVEGVATGAIGVFSPVAFLRVTTAGWPPDETPTISVDGEPMNTWGLWLGLPAGSHAVSFEAIAGLTTPCERVVTLTGGATTHVEGDYSDGSCDIVP